MDAQAGELRKVHIFVTTISVSSMIYAETFPDEKLPNFIAGTVHALDYYGSVPKYLVPDNLRAAVTKHTKDEPILNSAYQDLEQFYEVVILPPPARKPKGKATVEKGVQWLEIHLLEELKERVYYTLDELNRNVRRIVDNLNDRKIQGHIYILPCCSTAAATMLNLAGDGAQFAGRGAQSQAEYSDCTSLTTSLSRRKKAAVRLCLRRNGHSSCLCRLDRMSCLPGRLLPLAPITISA